jgi:DNA-binding IclR family transcriptional regulator
VTRRIAISSQASEIALWKIRRSGAALGRNLHHAGISCIGVKVTIS